MGQQQSRFQLDPNHQIRVIGCGMSRTGTSSFTAALEILLRGPVYHGGSALFLREESHIKRWVSILGHTPIHSPADATVVKKGLREQLKGYVACTDSPPIQFVAELMELYPDAKVICTVRDGDDWWRSMEPLVKNSKMGFLGFMFWPLPTLRWWTAYVKAMEDGRYGELYYQEGNKTCARRTYDYHMEYLQRVVPKEKLHIFEVKDGWEPLCSMLGEDVPQEPFPKINEAKATEEFFKGMIMKGFVAWAQIFSGGIAIVAAAIYLWGRT